MAWTAHQLVLRLRSPMHIGRGKVGNLQRTRPYVAGRNLWGALTARLARSEHPEGTPHPSRYRDIGQKVHDELAFTYLYPTVARDGTVGPWPWADGFRYRFLSTYASTALDYGAGSAEEASLHEVECLTPYTRDGIPVFLTGLDGRPLRPEARSPAHTRDAMPVFLTGYVFQQESSDLNWKGALQRLQIGGERGYGWGSVEEVTVSELDERPVSLFGTDHTAHLDGNAVRIHLAVGQPILAHTLAADFDTGGRRKPKAVPEAVVDGPVEPLVGRETSYREDAGTRFGVRLSQARICYVPGSRVIQAATVQIGHFAVWEEHTEPVDGKAP